MAYRTGTRSIDTMPRGGPDASWLDRHLETGRLEYTDRYDIPESRRRKVIITLERGGEKFGTHRINASLALTLVADVDAPRILEIGAGHGRLAAELLAQHPTAEVHVTDLDPASVAAIAAGPLGDHPRATVRVVDATEIDSPDRYFDVVVFSAALHHLPPGPASRVIADATRVGRRFLVIDLERLPPRALLGSPFMLLFVGVMSLGFAPAAAIPPFLHDAAISNLRAYSRSAFRALGAAAHPGMTVDFLPGETRFPPMTRVVYARP